MTQEKPRWLYRFDNYDRAFLQLRNAVTEMRLRPLSQLEKQGTVQCFEVAVELAWKVLKDFLEFEGAKIDSLTPKNIVRAAFGANLITDGEIWMDALEARNLMAHTYDAEKFEEIVIRIANGFYPLLETLHATLRAKADA